MVTSPPSRPSLLRAMAVWRSPVLWLALLATLSWLGYSVLTLWQHRQDQQLISRLQQGYDEAVPESARPIVLYARAHYLSSRDRLEDATVMVEALNLHAQHGDVRELARDALYNLANARLRQGIALLEQGRLDKASQPLLLAREYYVRSLRLQPDYWSARYNLDVNARMARQLPRQAIGEDDEATEVQDPDELWSEVPGTPRGLP